MADAPRRSLRASTAMKSAVSSAKASEDAMKKAVSAAKKGNETAAQQHAETAKKEAMKAKSVADSMKRVVQQSIKGSIGSRKSLSQISRLFGSGVSRSVARSLSARNMGRRKRATAFRIPRSAVERATSIAARAEAAAHTASNAAVRAGNTMTNQPRKATTARAKKTVAKSKTATKKQNNAGRHILPYHMSTQTRGSRMTNKRQASARSARAQAHRFSSVKRAPYKHANPNTIRRMRQQQRFTNRRFGRSAPSRSTISIGRFRRSTPRRFGRSTRRLSVIREENNNNL